MIASVLTIVTDCQTSIKPFFLNTQTQTMKIFLARVLAITTLSVLAAACSKNGPGDVAVAMRTDLCKTRDYSSMTKYLTEESKPVMGMVTAMANSPEKKATMTKALDETCAKPAKVASEVINGDTATVTLEGDKPMEMKKVDGKWLVSISKK